MYVSGRGTLETGIIFKRQNEDVMLKVTELTSLLKYVAPAAFKVSFKKMYKTQKHTFILKPQVRWVQVETYVQASKEGSAYVAGPTFTVEAGKICACSKWVPSVAVKKFSKLPLTAALMVTSKVVMVQVGISKLY